MPSFQEGHLLQLFLEKGISYRVTLFTDVPGSRDAQREVIPATSADVLNVTLEPRGGLAAIIEPVAAL